ncbi:MAG TPA: HlyD family efflux transporter periplasmic adaptor subunit [Pseudonocardia sp.]|jgi:HlyD family secretion protein
MTSRTPHSHRRPEPPRAPTRPTGVAARWSAAGRVGLPGSHGWWAAAVVLVTGLALVVAGCAGQSGAGANTATVALGSVSRTVSATGTLQAIDEQNLGFAKGGQLTRLLVAVGQRVNAGQPLAKIDDFEARGDLARARAAQAAAQARWDKIQDGNQVDAAHHDYSRARDVLGATRDEAGETDGANEDAIDQAREQLSEDRKQLAAARQGSMADKSRCNRSVTGGSHRYDGYGDNADVTSRDKRGLLVESPLDMHSPSCERSDRGQSAVSYYQRRIDQDQRSLDAARRRAAVEHARQRVAVANARRDSSAAGDSADGATSDKPHDLEEAAAGVQEAAADVRDAQRAIQDTLLIAPVAGTVASINGTVGEYIGSAAGTTPLAPGGRTALPDLDSGVGGKDDSNNKAQRPGGSSFLTLKNVHSFQIVAPFAEADAAQLAPNQKVQVSFDAVPDLTRTGTLTALSPTGAQINDVTNYYATVVLNDTDPRLRTGQTAEANVIVGGVDNVLVVPSAAVQRAGNTGVVQVQQPDGTARRVQVELGLVGDHTTQVLSGLALGQKVMLGG